VIDTVGGKTQGDLFAYVRKGGTLVSSVSVPDAELAQQCGIEAKFILVDVNTEDLEAIADMLDATSSSYASETCLRRETLDKSTRCWRECGFRRPAKSCSTRWTTHNIVVKGLLA